MTHPIRSFNLDQLLGSSENQDCLRVGGRVQYGPDAGLNIGSSFSVEVVFTAPSLDISRSDITLYEQNYSTYGFKIVVDSNLILDVYYNGTSVVSSTVSEDTKTHVCVVQHRADVWLYIDGVKVDTGTLSVGQLTMWPRKPTGHTYTDASGTYFFLHRLRIWKSPLFDYLVLRAVNDATPPYNRTKLSADFIFAGALRGAVPDRSINGVACTYIGCYPNNGSTKYLDSPAWRKSTDSAAYINDDTFLDYIEQYDYALSTDFWIKIEDTAYASEDIIKIEPVAGSTPWAVYLYTDVNSTQIKFRVNDRGGSFSQVYKTNLPLNTWIHLALTWDASGYTGVYLNGTGTKTANSLEGLDFKDNVQSIILGDGEYYGYSIRNMRIYNVRLTDEEVEAAYRYPTEYPVSRTNVVADWRFIEGNTYYAYDASDHGNYLYPIEISGAYTGVWEYEENSGFYPLMWDGYDVVGTAGRATGAWHDKADFQYDELKSYDNFVMECLYFSAYSGMSYQNVEGNTSIPDDNVMRVYYGQYIQSNFRTGARWNKAVCAMYYSGVGIGSRGYHTNDILYDYPPDVAPIDAINGKWHHVVWVYSSGITYPGTEYNNIIYHNGRIASAVNHIDTVEQFQALPDIYNKGELGLGSITNGAISVARYYKPSDDEITNWLDGTYVSYTTSVAGANCSLLGDQNLIFDAYWDEDNDQVVNIIDNTTSDLVAGSSVERIPLSWKYFSVAGTIPRYPTPKFALYPPTDSTYTEWSLEATIRVNTYAGTVYAIDSDTVTFYTCSGLYFANVAENIICSGAFTSYNWHSILYRYNEDGSSFLFDGDEIYSGPASGVMPTENIKFGFYANVPTSHHAIDVGRMALYDVWIDENRHLSNTRLTPHIDMPLLENLHNF